MLMFEFSLDDQKFIDIFFFDRHIQHSEGSNPDESKFQRKLFFKKRSTSSACAVS